MQIQSTTAQTAMVSSGATSPGRKPDAVVEKQKSSEAYKLELRSDAVGKLDLIRARIASGYYNRPEVLDALAERLMRIL